MNRNRAAMALLGAFVTISLVTFTWLSFKIGGFGSNKDNMFYAEFTDATGLAPQSDIKIAGISVGKVAAMALSEDEQALVTLALNDGIQVRKGTRAVIKSKSLLGEMFLALEPGPLDAALLPVGSTIQRTYSPLRVADIGEVMGPFVESLDPEKVEKALDVFFSMIEDNQEAFQEAGEKALKLLDLTSSLLETNEERINHLLIAGVKASRDIEEFLARHGNTLDTMVVDMGQASGQVVSVLDKVDTMLNDAPATMTEVTELTRNANRMMQQLAELDPMRAVEITKMILQNEGLTVNLAGRKPKRIREDIEVYRAILGRQEAAETTESDE